MAQLRQSSCSLLIIDNIPEARALYRQYLSKSIEGCTFLEADRGSKGLELYQQHPIDAILLSYNLPDMEGSAVLLRLGGLRPYLPAIVIAEDCVEVAVEAMQSGAQDYLVKSRLTPSALQRAVSRVLARRPQSHSKNDQREAGLQAQTNRLQIATAVTHLGIWDWDLITNELTWDAECRALFGVSSQTKVSMDLFLSAIHPDDRERTQRVVEAALAPSGNGRYEIEYRAIGLNDQIERWIKARGQAYFTDQVPQRFIGTVVEITPRKQAELALAERLREVNQLNATLEKITADLAERNKDLNQFAYVASHDLKAPLRSIRNLSEWLQDDIGNSIPLENQQQLSLIIERIDRMDALLNALLNYARAGRIHQAREYIDLGSLLREIVDILSPLPGVEICLMPRLPKLWGNRLALTQVFINLISNAIKYGCDGQRGKIAVLAQEFPDRYKFTVSDHGPGIDPSHHDRIFGIFERLQNPNESTGTGIGLAIVKRIVEAEGGKIWVESEPGQGAAFSFTWCKSQRPEALVV